MPRQTPQTHARRCLECNVKTKQGLWESPECPACGSAVGYIESAHGGLNKRELRKLLKERKTKGLLERPNATKGKERL